MQAETFEPVYLQLGESHWSDWAKNTIDFEQLKWAVDLHERWSDSPLPPIAGGSGTFSNWAETTVLAHVTGQDNAAWASLAPVYLALTTAVPDSSKTGSTLTEATYTGYARLSVANTAWAAPTSGGAGAASSISNNTTLTFAACTAGSSTIIGWALCTAATLGNVIAWGSATSTVISTTQTPATVATGALQLTLI